MRVPSQDGSEWVTPKFLFNQDDGRAIYLDGNEWKPVPNGVRIPEPAGVQRQMIQGMSMGFGDEIAGLGRAAGRGLRNATDAIGLTTPTGSPESKQTMAQAYNRGVANERSDMEAARRQSPWLTGAAELAGAVATYPARGAQALIDAAITGTSKGAQIARNFLGGALPGGIYGAGEGEGVGGTLKGAGAGTVLGGGVGAGIPLLAQGAGVVWQRAADALGMTNAQDAATKQILRAFERDGVSSGEATQRLAGWVQAGAKPEMFAELGGENLKALAATVARVPSVAKNQAQQVVTQRMEGQHGRVMEDVTSALRPAEYFGTEDAVIKSLRSPEVKRLYDKAYAEGASISDPRIDAVLATPAGKRAEAIGKRLMENDRVPFPEEGRSTQMLDYTKRALDDMIGQNVRAGARNNVRILQGLKDDLVAAVDEANPAFGAARARYKGDAEILTALREGRDFMTLDTPALAAKLKGLSDTERQAYVTGAGQKLKDMINSAGDNRDVTARIFGNQDIRDKLRVMVGDEARFDALTRNIEREKEMAAVNRMVSPRAGSQTAPLQAGMEDLSKTPLVGIAGRMAQGQGPIRATVGHYLEPTLRRAQGITPNVADQLADILMQTDPQRNLTTLTNLARQRGEALNAEQMKQRIAEALAARSGLLVGPQPTQRR